MKKLIVLLLVSLIVMVPLTSGAKDFRDVPSEHWAYDAINHFARSGTIIGVGDDMFEPDEFITREEFAKLLSEIFGKTDNLKKRSTFTDVSEDMWSYTYIESVKDYLTGYYPADGKAFFSPYSKAAREDVAYALVKIIGLDKIENADLDVLNKFEDSNEISYHLKQYFALAVSNGLMQGDENKLRPQDGITRAETATVLFRAIKKPVSGNLPESPNADKEGNADKDDKTDEPIVNDTVKGSEYSIITNNILAVSGYKKEQIKGEIELGWSPSKNTASFEAVMKCHNGGFDYADCEIKLTKAFSVDKNKITGRFYISVKKQEYDGTVSLDGNILTLTTSEYDIRLTAAYGETEFEQDPADEVKPDKDNEEKDDAEHDAKDNDKLHIKNTDNAIIAKNIYQAEISSTKNDNMTIAEKNISDGYVSVSFGDDALEDTELIAEFIVKGNKYRLESTEVSMFKYQDNGNSISMRILCDLYKNDTLILEDASKTLVVNKDNDVMDISGRVTIGAEGLKWNIEKLPPEAKAEEKTDDRDTTWDNAKFVYAFVDEFSGAASGGDISIYYNEKEKAAKVTVRIMNGNDNYVIELAALSELTDDEIKGVYKITQNDKTVADNVQATLKNYKGNVEETVEFICSDDKYNSLGHIVEKAI